MSELTRSRLRERFDSSWLLGQFILCRREDLIPAGWSRVAWGAGWLAHHETLPVLPIEVAGGEVLGWVLGYPIDGSGQLRGTGERLRWPSQSAANWDAFEQWLYDFGGRFAAVARIEGRTRFYLDPSGSLSAVYAPTHAVLAASSFLIPDDGGCHDDPSQVDAYRIFDSDHFYAFGLTGRKGVHRLLPNHYLDLDQWRAVRHWPNEGRARDLHPEEAIEAIAGPVRRAIAGICARHRPCLALTAGHDSRLLLACARAQVERLDLFTFAYDAKSRQDTRWAVRIARAMKLPHRVVGYVEPDEAEVAAWFYKTGACVGERRGVRAIRAFKALGTEQPILFGIVGDLVRGSEYWSKDDAADRRPDPVCLVRRLELPVTPAGLSAAEQWRDSLPSMDGLEVLDWHYLEQRLGCWAGVWPYGYAEGRGFQLFPLNHRSVIEAMIRLPLEFRMGGRTFAMIVAALWPELARFPYNQPVGWRRVTSWARTCLPGWTRARRMIRVLVPKQRRTASHSGAAIPS
ncbi:MAG TPA: hypothetical protein VNO52_13435 [Methylomirabilota bacterium]|nr:hypothetical protein [Methylomirabilota bacterium]